MNPPSVSLLSDYSPTILGISLVFASIIMYTAVTKMLGLSSKNEFEVDDRVSLAAHPSRSKLLIAPLWQTVVITGGSDGMGKSVACQLAAKGANVVIVARTTSKLKAALEHIKVGLKFVLPGYWH